MTHDRPQALPYGTVRLTRLPRGIELFFPPFRTPDAALGLALFGAACFVAGSFAAIAVVPLAESGPGGAIALWLMSIFIVPFLVFGVVFPLLAVHVIANSLTVSVTEAEIRSRRRVLGFALQEQRLATRDIAALDAVTPMRYRWPRRQDPYLSLVARTAGGAGHNRRVTLAEGLRGEGLLEQVKAEIVKAGALERLLETRDD